MMINRVVLLVVDGLGVGATADAAQYGDANAHTLSHLAELVGGLNLPTLESLGLGHVCEIQGVRRMAQPIGCFGRAGFTAKGVDSLVGYWELAGCHSEVEGGTFSDGYPPQVVAALEQAFGGKVLCQKLLSGTAALREYGASHLSTGSPIVWTDGRQTCHVAAHESVWNREELFQRSKETRKVLKDTWGIRRVVAHPLSGPPGELTFAPGRRDCSGEPPSLTMLDALNRAGQLLIGVGKVGDLFGGRGLTRSVLTATWNEALDEVGNLFNKVPRGLIFAGVDLDAADAERSAASLHDFDRRLPGLLEQLRAGDLLILTSDHGRDPGKPHGVPTRECVPVLTTGPKLAEGVNLGLRATLADVGQTIVEALQGSSLEFGESFLDALRQG